MLGRCVVIVDGSYLRNEAGRQLVVNGAVSAAIQSVPDLVDTLRSIAEESTGQELLRLYWYERDEQYADAEGLRGAPYIKLRLGYVPGAESTLSTDLSALLAHGNCGDVVVCSDDPSLYGIMSTAQMTGRHVHLLRVGEPRSQEPGNPLRDVSDTHRWWPSDAIAVAFRVPDLIEPRARSHMSATPLTIADPTREAIVEHAPETVVTAADGEQPRADHAHGAMALRPSPFRQEQSDYLAARLRTLAAARPSLPSPAPTRVGFGNQAPMPRAARRAPEFGAAYSSDRLLNRHDAPRTDFYATNQRSEHVPLDGEVARSVDMNALLREIAENVVDEVLLPDAETLRTWEFGIPAHIDRQLLGCSHSRLGVMLDGTQKIQLRHYFREACQSRRR